MGELSQFLAASRKGFGLHVIENPSGTFSFVGSVPVSLRWVAKDGSPADPAEIDKAASFGPRFADVKTRTFATREDALAAAEGVL